MASVAYNFMVVDPNSHSRRYSEHNSTSPATPHHHHHPPPHPPHSSNCRGDRHRGSQVALDLGSSTASLTKRRKSRKKSSGSSGTNAKERGFGATWTEGLHYHGEISGDIDRHCRCPGIDDKGFGATWTEGLHYQGIFSP
ncbi:hypothetical protein ACOMHN_041767 [Nucella lapillus]